jgi:membrane-associated phospholipid phosphatase
MDAIRFLQSFASPTLDTIMLVITNLGSEQAYIVLLIVIYLSIDSRVGRWLGMGLLVSLYLNFTLKGLFDTERPYAIDPAVSRGPQFDATGTGPSFPSGHAQASATFWFLSALYFKRSWLYPLSVLLVVLISLSRVYLGLHFIVDIVGGIGLGVLMVLLSFELSTRLMARGPLNLFERATLIVIGIAAPLAVHLTVPQLQPMLTFHESSLFMGALAAFISGPLLYPHQAPRTLGAKLALALLGVLVVFAVLYGSSMLPETLRQDPLGGFVRYLLLGYSGLILTPFLARQINLAPRALPTS